jgi:pimeloyl-ACP methyl ester carboxylesterase
MPKLKTDDASLYYEIYGEGKPLLLIAGLGSDSSSWAGVVKIFSRRFQTVVFDNRGTGRSSSMRKSYTIRRMADDTVRLLDQLGIERAHILGHSMGGYIAQQIAISYPERIDRLILEGTAAVSSKRNNILFFEFFKNLQRKEDFKEWIRAWTFWLFSPKTFENKEFISTFIKKAAEYPYRTNTNDFKAQAEVIAKFDLRGRLSAIRAKTLIIGGKDDILIMPDEAGVLAKQIRGSVIKLITGCAHCIHIENPALFTKAVLDFLR